MRAAGGTACPMHQATASHLSLGDTADSVDDCHMRGPCEGPAVALSALISIPGILPSIAAEMLPTMEPLAQAEAVPIPISFASYDTPPPKA